MPGRVSQLAHAFKMQFETHQNPIGDAAKIGILVTGYVCPQKFVVRGHSPIKGSWMAKRVQSEMEKLGTCKKVKIGDTYSTETS